MPTCSTARRQARSPDEKVGSGRSGKKVEKLGEGWGQAGSMQQSIRDKSGSWVDAGMSFFQRGGMKRYAP